MRNFIIFLLFPFIVFAETAPKTEQQIPDQAVERVEIKPVTQDSEIRKRLENILNATGWFDGVSVEVKEGIVFLSGEAKKEDYKKWAGNLAKNTQNVVAVVNKIEVEESSIGDFSVISQILYNHWRGFLKAIPSIIIGIAILLIAWGISYLGFLLGRVVNSAK